MFWDRQNLEFIREFEIVNGEDEGYGGEENKHDSKALSQLTL